MTKRNIVIVLASVIMILGSSWYFYGGGLQRQANKNLYNIYQKVASDSVEQYDIAKRNGSKMDTCVRAGLVAAAYLQAKDELNYRQWKKIESDDCSAAGLPK